MPLHIKYFCEENWIENCTAFLINIPNVIETLNKIITFTYAPLKCTFTHMSTLVVHSSFTYHIESTFSARQVTYLSVRTRTSPVPTILKTYQLFFPEYSKSFIL